MTNLTLAVEDEVLTEARKLADAEGTTLNGLVREYLKQLVESRISRRAAAVRLKHRMSERPLTVGARSWSRDELHER